MELDTKYFWLLFCCNRVTCSFVWPPSGAVVLPVKHQGRCYMNLFLYRSDNISLIQMKQAPSKYWLGERSFNGKGWSRFREKMMCPWFPSQLSSNTEFLFVVHLRKAVVINRGLQCLIQWGFVFSITPFLWVWLFFNGSLMLMDFKYALRIRFGSQQHAQYAMLSILNIILLYYVCVNARNKRLKLTAKLWMKASSRTRNPSWSIYCVRGGGSSVLSTVVAIRLHAFTFIASTE